MTDPTARPAPEPQEEPLEGVQALLDRMCDDLDAGFVELMRHYGSAVYSVALRVSGQPFDADDLTAEAFLRAYRALRGYGPERIAALRPRAWLMTILLNTWRNAARDSARQPREVALRDGVDPPVGGPSVEDVVEADETLGELARLVAELPAPHRAAVVLRHVVGMPTAEVAAALGCPEGTAKSYVSRGLSRLRLLYAEHQGRAPAVVTPFVPPAARGARRRAAATLTSVDGAAPMTAAGREHR